MFPYLNLLGQLRRISQLYRVRPLTATVLASREGCNPASMSSGRRQTPSAGASGCRKRMNPFTLSTDSFQPQVQSNARVSKPSAATLNLHRASRAGAREVPVLSVRRTSPTPDAGDSFISLALRRGSRYSLASAQDSSSPPPPLAATLTPPSTPIWKVIYDAFPPPFSP